MLFNKLALTLLGIVAAAAALPMSSTNVPFDTGVTKRTSDDLAKRAADVTVDECKVASE